MELKATKLSKLNFWQQWLIHGFILWTVLTTYDLFTYWASVQRDGYFLFYEDGTPVTIWQRFVNHNFEEFIWVGVFIAVYFIEAAYHIVFRHLQKIYKVIGVVLGVACILFFAIDAISHYQENGFWVLQRLDGFLYVLFFSAVYGFIYAVLRDYISRRIKTAENKSEQSQAELNALKTQVNPHFFFNTLNSIYGTALEEKAPRTADSIEQLAGIMRYTMNEAQENYTAVANEVKFMEEYLHLQRLRLPERDNIEVNKEINYDGKPANIAPMLLIPFIENAFKYGISIDNHCFVHVCLHIVDQKLKLVVRNTITRSKSFQESNGTGIANTIKRLELLYPDHKLKIINDKDTFEVDLQLALV